VAAAGCRTFHVHARNAVLRGLSPRENREVPRLRYGEVYRLKREFPELEVVLNGGIADSAAIESHLRQVDGVMIGRAAYANPWLLADAGTSRAAVVRTMANYARRVPALRHVTRHMLGLFHGHRRARLWRRMLSDAARLSRNDPALLEEALAAVESHPEETSHECGTEARHVRIGS
jgi:tRNA-dihydrouridine synthase A